MRSHLGPQLGVRFKRRQGPVVSVLAGCATVMVAVPLLLGAATLSSASGPVARHHHLLCRSELGRRRREDDDGDDVDDTAPAPLSSRSLQAALGPLSIDAEWQARTKLAELNERLDRCWERTAPALLDLLDDVRALRVTARA